MNYAEKKRKRIEEMVRELDGDADSDKEDPIIPLSDRIRKEECVPYDSRDAIIASIERLHYRRDALLKASSIARSMLARAKSCEAGHTLRKAADQLKHDADRMGEEMVRKWIDEAMDDR